MLNQERLDEVLKTDLRNGTGSKLSEKICVMQAVDYVATGGLSDHPECACPMLTSFAIRLNDRMDDESRQMLKPLIPKLVGTRDKKTKDRSELLVFRSITVTFPILMEACGLLDDAAELRSFKSGDWEGMRAFCEALKSRLREAVKTKLASASASASASSYAAYAAADAAYCAAHADAASASSYAAYYAAYADAASASCAADADASYWLDVRKQIWESAIESLSLACEIRGDER